MQAAEQWDTHLAGVDVVVNAVGILRERRGESFEHVHHLSLPEYLTRLRGGTPRWQCTVPAWLARGVAFVCDLLHVTPFSFGHYELLQYDNYPLRDRTAELLGRAPRRIERCHSKTCPPQGERDRRGLESW